MISNPFYGYLVIRCHTDALAKANPEVKEEWFYVYRDAFGNTTLQEIFSSCCANRPLLFWRSPPGLKPLLDQHISVKMRLVLAKAAELTVFQYISTIGGSKNQLSYEMVLEFLDKAVEILRGEDVGNYFPAHKVI